MVSSISLCFIIRWLEYIDFPQMLNIILLFTLILQFSIMLVLYLMLSMTHYAQNYAGIIGGSLTIDKFYFKDPPTLDSCSLLCCKYNVVSYICTSVWIVCDLEDIPTYCCWWDMTCIVCYLLLCKLPIGRLCTEGVNYINYKIDVH